MTCTNCALSVEKQLLKAGMQGVEVNFIRGEASFENVKKVPVETLGKELRAIGYEVVRGTKSEQGFFHYGLKQKLLISAAFTLPLLLHMVLPHDSFFQNPWFQFALALPVYIIGVFHFGKSAIGSLRGGVPNMDVLIFLGSTAAFFYSLVGVLMYPAHAHDFLFFETAATIITLVLLGNFIEEKAVAKTAESTKDLYDMQPKEVRVQRAGNWKSIVLEEVRTGDLIRLAQGDYVPVDGVVEENHCTLDMRFLTGESEAIEVREGSSVKSGSLISVGNIVMKAQKSASQSTLSEIIRSIESAQGDKPAIQRLGDRISAVFVPVVVGISLLTFLIGHFAFHIPTDQALMRAIAVLVISCPCAMGLAAPTAIIVGFGRAARNGILLRKGSALEGLAQADLFVFDKTGTLTSDKMQVAAVTQVSGESLHNLAIAKTMTSVSAHPLSKAIYTYLERATPIALKHIQEEKGSGVKAQDADGNRYFLGKSDSSPQIVLSMNDQVLCSFSIREEIKPGTKKLIDELKKNGKRVIMLSGDHPDKCAVVAAELGIEEYYARHSPFDKIEKVRNWAKDHKVVMTGDGINDAAALAQAHVAISMSGAKGIAQQNAQIILMHNRDMNILSAALSIGQHTMLTIKQNFFWAFAYNAVAIPIAALGFLNPMVAAFSMAFSDVVVVGNSLRLRWKKIF